MKGFKPVRKGEEKWASAMFRARMWIGTRHTEQGLHTAKTALLYSVHARQALAVGRLVEKIRPVDALPCYRQALEIDPDFRPARLRLAFLEGGELGERIKARLEGLRAANVRRVFGDGPEGVEAAVERILRAFDGYCRLRESGDGPAGRALLGGVRGGRVARKIYYYHPVDRASDCMEDWTKIFFQQAQLLPDGGLGEWSKDISMPGGDPASRESAVRLIERVVRRCW